MRRVGGHHVRGFGDKIQQLGDALEPSALVGVSSCRAHHNVSDVLNFCGFSQRVWKPKAQPSAAMPRAQRSPGSGMERGMSCSPRPTLGTPTLIAGSREGSSLLPLLVGHLGPPLPYCCCWLSGPRRARWVPVRGATPAQRGAGEELGDGGSLWGCSGKLRTMGRAPQNAGEGMGRLAKGPSTVCS